MGRERDAEAAGDLVLREGVRLVTLTGPGGVGKSRLALEVARRLGPRFADGVRFVDLAPVQRADLVVAAIAAGLGLRTTGGPLIADVKAYLRPRRLVLLLDNFEQVTAAAPLVAELLAAAEGLVVLVTSRTVLRLSGEHEFAVAPLPTPPAGTAGGPQLAGLRRYASVRLFVERAHAAAPGFELTSENAGAIAEICRRLDGLPLAIELAAARSRLLPPEALLARLDDRMSLLTGGARDLPERQRTLRNTLDWSFGLLSPAAQALFSRLGVFPGSFDLEAGEAVGGAGGSAPAARTRPRRSSTRWPPWWTPAWSARRTRPASRASRCWRLSAITPANGCARAASGRRRTTGTLPISWSSPSAASGRAGRSQPGGLAGPAGSRAR